MTTRTLRKPALLDDFDLSRPVVVEASAGTGKTHLLLHLVCDLVIAHAVPLSEIVVVTFTEKAAGELRARLRARLRAIADGPSEESEGESAWIVDDERAERARHALLAFDRAAIGTIHQFAFDTMRELGVLAGDPILHVEEIVADPFDEAWRSVLRRRIGEPGFARYWSRTDERSRASLERAVLELTKTRAPLDPSPDDVRARLSGLFATFVAAGAPHMPNVDDHVFHPGAKWAWTRIKEKKRAAYRAFTKGLLDTLARHARDPQETPAALDGLALELLPLQVSLDEADDLPAAAVNAPTAFTREEFRAFIDRALDLFSVLRTIPIASLGEDVATSMRRLHDRRGTLSFTEMIWRLRDALVREDSSGGETPLRDALRARARFALIDEFQDTDEAQWDIFRTVFLRGAHERSDDDGTPARGLVLVGDPKQAIYTFRGADFHAYQSAVRACVDTFGGRVHRLLHTHRTAPTLSESLAHVMGDTLFPEGEGIAFPRVESVSRARLDDDGRAPLVILTAPRVEDAQGRVVEYRKDEIDRAFASGVAREIARLLSSTTARLTTRDAPDTPRAIGPSDIAVLARSHSDLEVASRALRDEGVPFVVYKKRGLFHTDEAHDLLDLLVAVLEGGALGGRSRGSVARAIATPFFAIASSQLDDVLGFGVGHPIERAFAAWEERAASGDIAGLLRDIARRSQVLERLLFVHGERAASNMAQLFDVLLAAHAETGHGLAELVEDLRRRTRTELDEKKEADLLRLESERARVRLLTMHTAKGLEFPIVFLVGGYRGVAAPIGSAPVIVHRAGRAVLAVDPGSVKIDVRREESQEQARLFYVAATRAEERLYMPSWAPDQVSRTFDDGIYARVCARTRALVDAGGAPGIDVVQLDAPTRATPTVRRPPSAAEIARVRAAPRPAPVVVDEIDHAALSRARRGPTVTSFTALSRAVAAEPREPSLAMLSADPGPEERLPDETDVELADLDEETPLPGGTLVGLAFHRVLELLDWRAARGVSFDAWRADVARTIDPPFRQLGFGDVERRQAARLVYGCLTRPVAALGGACFAEVEDVVREVDFRMPGAHLAHGVEDVAQRADEVHAERVEEVDAAAIGGSLIGSIDAIVRHRGRVFLVDWKSNVVPSATDPTRTDYGRDALVALTHEKYGLQQEIYLVALRRWLGVTDAEVWERTFGGVLYVYMRGFASRGDDEQGVAFARPSFDRVRMFEQKLAALALSAPPPRAEDTQAAWRSR